jgi:hypothetical protein
VTGRNVGASVRTRLLARARETRLDFSLVLTRYAIERLLYRIGVSRHADHFLLKGALLFDLWFDVPHRPTRDVALARLGEPPWMRDQALGLDRQPPPRSKARGAGHEFAA